MAEDPLADALYALDQAITNPGSHPGYHQEMCDKLQAEWPVLWDAIEAVRETQYQHQRRR